MEGLIYKFFFIVRIVLLFFITFKAYKNMGFFLSRSTYFYLSQFEILKKKLYMTGIAFVVGANVLFYPEVWNQPEKAEAVTATQNQVLQPKEQLQTFVNEPISKPIEKIQENNTDTEAITDAEIEAKADAEIYEAEAKSEISTELNNMQYASDVEKRVVTEPEPYKPVLIMGH